MNKAGTSTNSTQRRGMMTPLEQGLVVSLLLTNLWALVWVIKLSNMIDEYKKLLKEADNQIITQGDKKLKEYIEKHGTG